MKKEPVSIRVDDRERSWGSRYGLGLGTQIREDIHTLKHLVRSVDLKGRFTSAELYVLVEVLSFYKYAPQSFGELPQLIASEVWEYMAANRETDWNIDELKIHQKLSQLTPVEAYKLIHCIRMAANLEESFKNAANMVKEYLL